MGDNRITSPELRREVLDVGRGLAAKADALDKMAFYSQPLLKYPEQGRHTLLEILNLSKHYCDVQVIEELEPMEALHVQYVS
ncbi:MAG: hypothetical protein OXH50_10800 [Gemmatimonadetes bacterium]|nr:hypothetical protein [Gemmatimonadota bacterium]